MASIMTVTMQLLPRSAIRICFFSGTKLLSNNRSSEFTAFVFECDKASEWNYRVTATNIRCVERMEGCGCNLKGFQYGAESEVYIFKRK